MEYVTTKELREEIISSHKQKKPTEKLITLAGLIFEKRMKCFRLHHADRDDAIQSAWELFLKNWHRIDSKKNIFSYLTAIANSGVTNAIRLKRMREQTNSNLFDSKDGSL